MNFNHAIIIIKIMQAAAEKTGLLLEIASIQSNNILSRCCKPG
jgi:hypothetical protein